MTIFKEYFNNRSFKKLDDKVVKYIIIEMVESENYRFNITNIYNILNINLLRFIIINALLL